MTLATTTTAEVLEKTGHEPTLNHITCLRTLRLMPLDLASFLHLDFMSFVLIFLGAFIACRRSRVTLRILPHVFTGHY